MVSIKRRLWAGIPASMVIGCSIGWMLPTWAAPPLGSDVGGEPISAFPERAPRAQVAPRSAERPAAAAADSADSIAEGDAAPLSEDGSGRADEPAIGVSPDPIPECPPETPLRMDATLCVNQATLDAIESGQQLHYDPATGEAIFTNPALYDPINGGYAYNAATEACDPNLDVLLKEAAVAGSQATRGIVNRQMDYPDTDPLIAVKNPQRDGYGGACTVSLMTFDLRDLLGFDPTQTLEEIHQFINALGSFDSNDLFGAACQVFNTVLGDLQQQLIQEIQQNNPLTPYQQFVQAVRLGFVTPLQSWVSLGLTPRPTTAILPGVATGSLLEVVSVPEVGYVYLARLSDLSVMVVAVSATPLAPGDAE